MWKTVKLGDSLSIARGGSPRPIKSFITKEDDGINWIKIGDTTQGGRYIESTKEKIKPSGVSRSRYVKSGDFLLSNSMSFGRPYILKTDGCIHDGWLVLSDYEEIFAANYLYYLLSAAVVQSQFEKLARGSTVRNLNIELVSNVVVSVPPLAEQQRIVAKLDAAFAEIDRAVEVEKDKQRQVTALYDSRITELLAQLMHEREHKKLSDLCDRITVGYVGKMSNQYTEDGVPFLRSQSIRPYRISSEGLLYISEEFDESIAKSRLNTNDVCVVRTGYPGIAAVVNEEWNGANCSDLVIFTPSAELNPYFLELFFNSDYGKTLVMGKVVGAAQKHFNVTSAKEVDFPVADLEEQQSIVSTAERLRSGWENTVSAISRKEEQLACLKSAILAQELQPPQSEAA